MDDHWLHNLTQTTAVIVPTQSLSAHLKEQIADFRIAQGQSVWEAPNIFIWREYLQILWHHNRERINQLSGASSLISARQSALLWTQVIESSRSKELSLTLLDVQQTVRAVQRSWRLVSDWCVQPEQIANEHVADAKQFAIWVEGYQALLTRRGFMDELQLQRNLIEINALPPFSSMIWYSYDLMTAAQKALAGVAENSGCEQRHLAPESPPSKGKAELQHLLYPDTESEIRAACQAARTLIERDSGHKVNIVIPDLRTRYAMVQEIAREIFYPTLSPLEVQLAPTAYRLSLGQPLNKWPAIETALTVLKMLNNRITVAELSFLLRNRYVDTCRGLNEECLVFERWLSGLRMRQIKVDDLPKLYQQCLDHLTARQQLPVGVKLLAALQSLADLRKGLADKLYMEKQKNGFAVLSFKDWADYFNQWLSAWGWHASVSEDSLNSVQYQLQQRWVTLLTEYSRLALVQNQIGLRRALEILRSMARETIFQPQAVASPILISGVLEAIGRPVDTCFLLSMDQNYPGPPQADAFISNRVLRAQGFPDASPETSLAQAQQVVRSVFTSANRRIISYARQHDRDREIDSQVSPLFRQQEFVEVSPSRKASTFVRLDQYQDIQGPSWPASKTVSGGTRIFENQSLCAFRGFVTHRLGFQTTDEAEFGLDSLDRGIIVHKLLDNVWASLRTQQRLLDLDDLALDKFVAQQVEQIYSDPDLNLTEDKKLLLNYEQPRLRNLLTSWLKLEKKRPIGFSVVEREEQRSGDIGGIKFRYTIDRLDLTDDGRSVVIDYKTGAANRNDWQGERLKSPQLPIYALALDKAKAKPVDGISFARVQQLKPEFVELCEAGILKPANNHYALKHEASWHQQRIAWPQTFEQLAADFLNGKAQVNPIDQRTCEYCELHSVCRVSQLRVQSALPLGNSG